MILGLSLSTFVTVHVIISLIGIAAGFIVMSGMLGSNRMPGWTALFLLLTILTSATGFLIPPLVSLKIGPLHALAPSVPPSEPPFAILQGIVLVFFIIFIIGAIRRFRPAPQFA
jgi:hypothetical protein